MKVWNLTVKTVVKDGKVVKGRTRKTNYRKDKLWSDRSGIPVLGGRWWQQAQSILDDAEKRQEMRKPFGSVGIVLHWTSETYWAKENLFIIWNGRLWKFNQLKPSFPDGTHSYHKTWICHEAMCYFRTQNECILWGRRVDCLFISIIFKCKPFSDFRSIIVFTMLPSIVIWVHNKYCIEHISA